MNAAELPPLVPGPRGYRTSDLHGLPAGPHDELIDGCVIASPPPTVLETEVSRWLANTFEIANRGSPLVVDRGQPVRIGEHDEVRPDVLVTQVALAETTPIPAHALTLAVEVVSRTSLLRDLVAKRLLYARAGVLAYWIVVPRRDPPCLVITELRRDDATGRYVERTPPTSEAFSTDHPWRFTVDVPALAAHAAASASWVETTGR